MKKLLILLLPLILCLTSCSELCYLGNKEHKDIKLTCKIYGTEPVFDGSIINVKIDKIIIAIENNTNRELIINRQTCKVVIEGEVFTLDDVEHYHILAPKMSSDILESLDIERPFTYSIKIPKNERKEYIAVEDYIGRMVKIVLKINNEWYEVPCVLL